MTLRKSVVDWATSVRILWRGLQWIAQLLALKNLVIRHEGETNDNGLGSRVVIKWGLPGTIKTPYVRRFVADFLREVITRLPLRDFGRVVSEVNKAYAAAERNPEVLEALLDDLVTQLPASEENGLRNSYVEGRAPNGPIPVRFRAGVPRHATPEQEFSVRFVAHASPEREQKIDSLLRAVDEAAEARPEYAEACWELGTQAVVICRGDHLVVSPSSQQFTWQGRVHHLDFDIRVAPGTSVGTRTRVMLDVAVGGVVVGRLRAYVNIHAALPPLTRTFEVSAQSARTAFASYASEDRLRVLDRVAEARFRAGLNIWMDCVSLRPNDRWRELLGRQIQRSELFLLFWSEHAASSRWVDWEWRTAYASKGVEGMELHPLQNVAVPPELAELHASDPYMDLRATYEERMRRNAALDRSD